MANFKFVAPSLILLTLVVIASHKVQAGDDEHMRDILEKEVDEIVRMRGYNATEFFIKSKDGYILSLIRCTNPLINKGKRGLHHKKVLLITHGTLSNNNYFVANSRDARPKSYHKIALDELTEKEINELVADDKGKNSLPFLALNCGHEVWFLNRRGSPRSRRRVNGKHAGTEHVKGGVKAVEALIEASFKEFRSSLNPMLVFKTLIIKLIELVSTVKNGDFWDYSLDEQAAYDLPAAINFILRKTGRKDLAVLGHSTGGTIVLMALAHEPELARNISLAITWAPAAELGHSLMELLRDGIFAPLTPYIGPVPPIITEPIFQKSIAKVCSSDVINKTLCKVGGDFLYGLGGPNVRYPPGFSTAFPKSVAAREVAQLSQSFFQGSTRYFNYGSKGANQKRYGKDRPPEYNFRAIKLKNLYLITGKTDGLVGPGDIFAIADKLSFKPKVRILTDSGKFNHVSYFVSSNCSKLIIVPTIRLLNQS